MYDTMIFSETHEMITFLNEYDNIVYINHERLDGFILLIYYIQED